jgi:DNA-binding NarL/FixJ family response regulator
MGSMAYIPTMITVGIIEDDPKVREAIKDFCNSQRELSCDMAEPSAESFLRQLNEENVPEVILMDIGLPGMSGISAIRLIKQRFPDVDIIMLTIYMDSHKIFESLCAGASGYLLKTTPFSAIKEAIEVVHRGGAPMSPQIARKVIDHFHGVRSEKGGVPLTPREKEIVLGLVEGLSYKMLADTLAITIETVRSHIKNIYQKLHIHSKAEVISKSLRGEI